MKTTLKQIKKGNTLVYQVPYFKIENGVVEKIKQFQCVSYKLLKGKNSRGSDERVKDSVIFYTDDKQEGIDRCRAMVLQDPDSYGYSMELNPEYKQVEFEFLTNNNVGIVHEGIIAALILDLEHRNNLVNSMETGQVIMKLQECLQLLRKREIDRVNRGVLGTPIQ